MLRVVCCVVRGAWCVMRDTCVAWCVMHVLRDAWCMCCVARDACCMCVLRVARMHWCVIYMVCVVRLSVKVAYAARVSSCLLQHDAFMSQYRVWWLWMYRNEKNRCNIKHEIIQWRYIHWCIYVICNIIYNIILADEVNRICIIRVVIIDCVSDRNLMEQMWFQTK
jgi:hypothetical protein